MSTFDFAAAQARIAARRAARERDHERTQRVTPPASFDRLPPGLREIAQSSLDFYGGLQCRTGTRPTFRVGQVDAELLDEELLSLLKSQIGDGLKYFGSHIIDDWSSEILTALRAILWKLSIWDRNASYGASLQGLRYVDSRRGSAPTRWQKAGHGFLTVVGQFGWQKWESWLMNREEDGQSSLLIQRLNRTTKLLSTTHELTSLLSFLVFLYNGKYRTLSDRLLRLRLSPALGSTNRQVSFEYLNRQLVWHAFTEFLLFVLPLVGVSRWKRILSRLWKQLIKLLTRRKTIEDDDIPSQGELAFLPERTCAICYKDQTTANSNPEASAMHSLGAGGVVGSVQTDITNPYEAIPCGCVYCFVCLAHAIEASEGHGWTCLRCGEPSVTQCKPWSGDIVEEVLPSSPTIIPIDEKRMSRKSVVFAEEISDDNDDDDHTDGERHIKGQERLSFIDPVPVDFETYDKSHDDGDIYGSDTTDTSQSCSDDEGDEHVPRSPGTE